MSHSLIGLKPTRKLLNISADDIAERIGVTTDSFRRLERGERRCYLDKAIVIAHMLGVAIEQLTREPTEAERVELFKAGEQRRALLERSGGDEALAEQIEALSEWSDE